MKLLSLTLLAGLVVCIIWAGFLIPEHHYMPVAGAKSTDWNPKAFWYYPWGRSGTHKGIDIFADLGTQVLAASDGLVLYTGNNDMGGNFVLVLGSKWRCYYYAHLQNTQTKTGQWLTAGTHIGTVGNTGNAIGKPPHLHFSIRSLWPLIWQYNFNNHQAWQKVFYVDPGEFLASG